MNSKPRICVFSGSAPGRNGNYCRQARELGRLCADIGIIPISGGGNTGLMCQMIEGCLEAGGETVGVVPQFMIDNNWHHKGVTNLEITDDMHQRKNKMYDGTLAAVALPGGIGTLEELMEIITWKQLGLYHGEVIIMNVDGYYNPLLDMLHHSCHEGFLKNSDMKLWHEVKNAVEAADIINSLIK